MQDHGLFQAICRVNRLDGDGKEYGYVIDYKDLFKSLETSIKDYTTEAFDGFDKDDVAGLLTDRLKMARERLAARGGRYAAPERGATVTPFGVYGSAHQAVLQRSDWGAGPYMPALNAGVQRSSLEDQLKRPGDALDLLPDPVGALQRCDVAT